MFELSLHVVPHNIRYNIPSQLLIMCLAELSKILKEVMKLSSKM